MSIPNQTYTYLVGFKNGSSLTFFIKEPHVADVLELALYNSEYEVVIGTFTGFISESNLHTEYDLDRYEFYKEYVDRFIYDSHSRCNEEIF